MIGRLSVEYLSRNITFFSTRFTTQFITKARFCHNFLLKAFQSHSFYTLILNIVHMSIIQFQHLNTIQCHVGTNTGRIHLTPKTLARYRDKQIHKIFLQPGCKFPDCGKKVQFPEKTHTDMGRTSKFHTECFTCESNLGFLVMRRRC